jgi:hypothetical protein
VTTKLHLACDGRGRSLSVVVTPGQRHESTQLGVVLDTIRVVRPKGSAGRPRKRPEHLISPTEVTASRGAGGCCGGAASRTPSQSGVTNASGVPGTPEDRQASTRSLTGGATWWSGA